MKRLVWNLLALAFLPAFVLAALLPGRRARFVWGPVPILSNRYWSEAIKAGGRDSITIMEGHYGINRREDWDFIYDDFAPRWLPHVVRMGLGACLAHLHVLRRAQVVHLTFDGFVLGRTAWWRLEAPLFRLAGIKTIVMPYGADVFAYSRIADLSTRYGLLASYPHFGRRDDRITERIDYWSRHADAMLGGFIMDGLPRWDVTTTQTFTIDTDAWEPKADYTDADGVNAPVRVLHTPNHRGFKGTEFVVDAVERLQAEGLKIELVLLEKVPNDQVRTVMRSVDILVEQIIWPGYALSGIEGMASGLTVLSNLTDESATRVLRRYAFLDECPIVATNPENIADNLRRLVRDPALRATLGRAGRAYAEKYHSAEAARFLFGSIYAKLLDGADVDLMNLYHPLRSAHCRAQPKVRHPLIDSALPPEAA